jgi:superfamily II DNA or RNA helicase
MGRLQFSFKNSSKVKEEQKTISTIDSPTLVVRNSFCTLECFPELITKEIEKLLTYENENIQYDVRRLYSLANYWAEQKKYRAVYAIRAKISKMEGEQKVCWLKGNQFPTGHLPMVVELLEALRFNDYKTMECREVPKNFVNLRWRNQPPELRYYQRDMVDLGIKHSRGVFEASVGSGKTLALLYILKELGVNSLIVVPSGALMDQIGRELRSAFGVKNVSEVASAKVKKAKKLAPIRIATIQTLASLYKQNLFYDFVKDIDLIACDEIHHAGSNSYTQLLPELDHVYYRFGFSGTFLRNDAKTLDMWGFMSNKLYHYPPYKATEDGFLTPVEMIIEKLPGVLHRIYNKEYDQNYCIKSGREGLGKGAKELLAAVLRRVEKIPGDEQILILVDRKDKSGKVIHEYLKLKGFDNAYVSGDNKREDIGDTIRKFNDKGIRILVGSTVLGEGVDVHSAQHLILMNGGKSPIKLVQAIGRCVRLHPGKTKSYVYDFCFEGTKYLENHCSQRVHVFRNHFAGEVSWL